MADGAASLGKPAAPVEPLNRGRVRGYFGQPCSTADDIAAPMHRNETRSLSLMSAFQVDSATAQSGSWRRWGNVIATSDLSAVAQRAKAEATKQSSSSLARPLRLLAFAVAAPIVCPIMRVSIITGGGIGIGAAVARRLAARDECLMLHGQGADAAGSERLKAVAADCERAGARVAWSTGDLADAGTASELVRAARDAFGRVDAIVHAAGFADRRGFAQLPRAGLERSFAVMATAFHELVSAALPDLTRAARPCRRHQQFRCPSVYAGGDVSGVRGGQGRARGAGALSCDRTRKLRRDGQCRDARLYAQGCRANGGAGPRELAIGRQGQSARTIGRTRPSGRGGRLSVVAGGRTHDRGRAAGRWRPDSDVAFCGGGEVGSG